MYFYTQLLDLNPKISLRKNGSRTIMKKLLRTLASGLGTSRGGDGILNEAGFTATGLDWSADVSLVAGEASAGFGNSGNSNPVKSFDTERREKWDLVERR